MGWSVVYSPVIMKIRAGARLLNYLTSLNTQRRLSLDLIQNNSTGSVFRAKMAGLSVCTPDKKKYFFPVGFRGGVNLE